MKKLKIAHFTQFLGIGGLEKVILELSLRQKSLSHEVSVIVYDHEQGWVDFFQAQGIRVITSIKKEEGPDTSLISQFNQLIHEEQFDIVHSHDINPLMYLSVARLLYFIKYGAPFKLIHTAHTLDHVENSKKIEIFERLVSHLAHQVIVVSAKIRNFYILKAKLAPEKIHLIDNGISQRFSSASEIERRRKEFLSEYSLSSDKPLALCLSRVVPLKDQLFLVNIFKDRHELQLLVVGPPSDQNYYDQIEKIIHSNPHQNIRMLGARSDVIELNEICDIYVSASTHEGLPVSVLEAMSVGTPCLVSDIAGHRNLNQYGDVVETYKIGNREDFTKKLNTLIIHLEKGQLAKYDYAKEIVDQYFSTKKMVDRYQEVYLK